MDTMNPRKLYIGNIPGEYTEADLVSDFSPFGRIVQIEFKGRFGFVEYDSSSAASDALAALTGMVRHGERLLVKAYRHIPPRNVYQQRGGYDGFDRGVGQSKRTAFRVAVLGLHEKTSWQDLKDFGRRVGEVNYADVSRGPEGLKKGLLEFYDEGTMNAAVRQLSGQIFLGAQVQVVPASSIAYGAGGTSAASLDKPKEQSSRDAWDRDSAVYTDERHDSYRPPRYDRRQRGRKLISPRAVRPPRVSEEIVSRGRSTVPQQPAVFNENYRSSSSKRYRGSSVQPPQPSSSFPTYSPPPPPHRVCAMPASGLKGPSPLNRSRRYFCSSQQHYRHRNTSSPGNCVGISLPHDSYYRRRSPQGPSIRSRSPRTYRPPIDEKEYYTSAPAAAPRYVPGSRHDVPTDYGRPRDFYERRDTHTSHTRRRAAPYEGNGVGQDMENDSTAPDGVEFRKSEGGFVRRRRRHDDSPSLFPTPSEQSSRYPPRFDHYRQPPMCPASPPRSIVHSRNRCSGSAVRHYAPPATSSHHNRDPHRLIDQHPPHRSAVLPLDAVNRYSGSNKPC